MEADKFPVNSIGHEVKAVNHLLHRKMLSSGSKSGIDKITIMHGWIIGYLYLNRDKDVFQKDIEQEFSIARSTATSILQLMEKKGYIRRVSVDSDARLKKLILTPKGIEVNSLIKKTIEENENSISRIFTDEELETFMRLIRKLKKGLEDEK